nr:STAS domain-containing protein [Planosporangium thailandense]
MTCATRSNGDEFVITLVGDADLTTVDQLRAALTGAVAGRPARIVVDVGGLAFIDSVGIGALVVASHAARQHGLEFVLTRPRGYVLRALTVTGVLDALTRAGKAGAA